ncbi:MAG TPA: hypothetical protein VJG13_09595, partial [Thermoanaerobaculia bacterium]|nr:hypothetical protein [Thermoanaerobaculia bacterium]
PASTSGASRWRSSGPGASLRIGSSPRRPRGAGETLLEDPDLANDSRVAARILAAFLGDKKDRIRQALAAGDYKTARKAVNGGSHGLEVFQECYQTGDRLLA